MSKGVCQNNMSDLVYVTVTHAMKNLRGTQSMGVSKRYTKCFLFNYILDEHVKSTENTPRSGYDEVCIYASRPDRF